MMKLIGGPAERSYMAKRAPAFLRAVVDAKGGKDVLDQLDDVPRPDEVVYVYRCISEIGHVHINGTHGVRGFYVLADYEYMANVDGEALRSTRAWREWCEMQENRA